MEQIYKNLYKNEKGIYLFATDNDTVYLENQQSYLLSYILEVLLKINSRDAIKAFIENKEKEEKENAIA